MKISSGAQFLGGETAVQSSPEPQSTRPKKAPGKTANDSPFAELASALESPSKETEERDPEDKPKARAAAPQKLDFAFSGMPLPYSPPVPYAPLNDAFVAVPVANISVVDLVPLSSQETVWSQQFPMSNVRGASFLGNDFEGAQSPFQFFSEVQQPQLNLQNEWQGNGKTFFSASDLSAEITALSPDILSAAVVIVPDQVPSKNSLPSVSPNQIARSMELATRVPFESIAELGSFLNTPVPLTKGNAFSTQEYLAGRGLETLEIPNILGKEFIFVEQDPLLQNQFVQAPTFSMSPLSEASPNSIAPLFRTMTSEMTEPPAGEAVLVNEDITTKFGHEVSSTWFSKEQEIPKVLNDSEAKKFQAINLNAEKKQLELTADPLNLEPLSGTDVGSITVKTEQKNTANTAQGAAGAGKIDLKDLQREHANAGGQGSGDEESSERRGGAAKLGRTRKNDPSTDAVLGTFDSQKSTLHSSPAVGKETGIGETETTRDLVTARMARAGLQLAHAGGGTARIQVVDKQYGTIDVSVKMAGRGSVTVEITTSSAALREDLERNADKIRSRLETQNLHLVELKFPVESVAATSDSHQGDKHQGDQRPGQNPQSSPGSGGAQSQNRQASQGGESGGERGFRGDFNGNKAQPRDTASSAMREAFSRQTNVQRRANGSLKVSA